MDNIDIPAFLPISVEDRRRAWERSPPRSTPALERKRTATEIAYYASIAAKKAAKRAAERDPVQGPTRSSGRREGRALGHRKSSQQKRSTIMITAASSAYYQLLMPFVTMCSRHSVCPLEWPSSAPGIVWCRRCDCIAPRKQSVTAQA
jgi:hypothetical protein